MIRLDSEGQIRFHYEEDDDEVASALKNILVNTEVGRDYKANYNTNATGAADYTKILNAAVAISGGPMISENTLLRAITLLIDSGEIKPKNFTQAAPLGEPEEDLRPRDKNGKLLTQAQQDWAEMSRFAESASTEEIRQRKHVDAKFRDFIATSMRRQMSGVADGRVPAGEPIKTTRANNDLVEFVHKYNAEPSDNLRPRGGYVRLAGEQIPYNRFLELVNAATNARLL